MHIQFYIWADSLVIDIKQSASGFVSFVWAGGGGGGGGDL